MGFAILRPLQKVKILGSYLSLPLRNHFWSAVGGTLSPPSSSSQQFQSLQTTLTSRLIMDEGVGKASSSSSFSTTNATGSREHRKKTAGLIIIGDEVLKGQVVDTNSHFICKHLYSMGVKVVRISVIGDGIEEIAHEVKQFSSAHDIVITTGGVGPTHDDMTYVGVAKAFEQEVQVHAEMATMIDKWLGQRGLKREVIMRMAQLPVGAKLIFDPALPPLESFPIVTLQNVYVLPGVPKFVEKMFPRMKAILTTGDDDNLFHNTQIYVNKDELSITHEIDLAVTKFKETVTFGSYPVDNLYYSTRITMESHNPENVKEAKNFLTGLMPPNSVIEYDAQPLETSTTKVYEIYDNPDHELYHVIRQAVSTVEEALDKFSSADSICICFNGGKDCTALLHIFHAVVQRKFPNRSNKEKLNALCIRSKDPFPEMETFVQECATRYNLKLWTYNGPILDGLRQALSEHPEMKAVLMGTRRSDPSGKNLTFFQMTDSSWPQVMRVSPLLEWRFGDVWKFIRSLTLSYCPLYDRGYTSIGNRGNTLPNPALAYTEDGKERYRPAYTLPDCTEERNGRQ
ncbi:FAD synthase isoform X1 [Folsomia candida]|uniref:FAD synthase isoform X1 n=1 Tax=Folsomia candida TaxID=158441 RepID=UPI000B904FD8|nr:FAD synthase isoform X1 [Folsomia candida]XP_035716220.1 FAD synthase isoform X1 [Folsomia candida]